MYNPTNNQLQLDTLALIGKHRYLFCWQPEKSTDLTFCLDKNTVLAVFWRCPNVCNLHKTYPIADTQWIVLYYTSYRYKDCRIFKPYKTRTVVFENREYKIAACPGTLHLLWWTIREEFSRILGWMEYFLSRRWWRRRLSEAHKRSFSRHRWVKLMALNS